MLKQGPLPTPHGSESAPWTMQVSLPPSLYQSCLERKEKIPSFSINLLRSQVVYRAARACLPFLAHDELRCELLPCPA